MCSSPQLFAAYRVLHRLPVPRHPPCALIRLTNCFLTFTVLVAVLVRTRGLSHCHAVSPACPPVFPGRHNLSLPLLITPRFVSYSSCASHSFELDTFCKIIVYAVFKVRRDSMSLPSVLRRLNTSFLFWRPPALPCRLQHSTIGRHGLNHRVRDGNGCVPMAHRHQKFSMSDFS